MSHNVWSGTDYAKTITDFIPYTVTSIVSSSNEWSSNGERSLKCECTKDNSYDGVRILNLGDVAATLKLTLYNPEGSVNVRLWSPNQRFNQTIVPSSDNPVEVSVYSNECYYLQLFSQTKQVFYIDNITLIK